MKMRARLKKQTRDRDRVVYLDGLGRVPRGSIARFGISHPCSGRKPFAVGWVKADSPNPVVHWGTPVNHPRP